MKIFLDQFRHKSKILPHGSSENLWCTLTQRKIKVNTDIPSEKLIIIPLIQLNFLQINFLEIRNEHLDNNLKTQLNSFLKDYKNLFQPPDAKLTFTTNINARIRTTDNEPIYS